MKTIVIDDDKISRVLVEKYIKKTKSLEFTGSFESAVEALNFPDIDNVELIFVDIEMPEMNGLEFVKSFRKPPLFVVISAKEQYAINAYDLDIADYLLKPIEYPRFLRAVQKAKDIASKKELKSDKSLFIKDGNYTMYRLNTDEIYWIESMENYITIVMENDKKTINYTMKAIEQQLPPNNFVRIHRSYIVNINKITAIEDNSAIIRYKDKNKSLPIAKSYYNTLMNKIRIISK